MILSHRNFGAVLQLEPNPFRDAFDKRWCAAYGDGPIVPKTKHGDGLSSRREIRYWRLVSRQRIKNARPRGDAASACHQQPPRPVPFGRDLVRLRFPTGLLQIV